MVSIAFMFMRAILIGAGRKLVARSLDFNRGRTHRLSRVTPFFELQHRGFFLMSTDRGQTNKSRNWNRIE